MFCLKASNPDKCFHVWDLVYIVDDGYIIPPKVGD